MDSTAGLGRRGSTRQPFHVADDAKPALLHRSSFETSPTRPVTRCSDPSFLFPTVFAIPQTFEGTVLARHLDDDRFGFLRPWHEFHGYYTDVLSQARAALPAPPPGRAPRASRIAAKRLKATDAAGPAAKTAKMEEHAQDANQPQEVAGPPEVAGPGSAAQPAAVEPAPDPAAVAAAERRAEARLRAQQAAARLAAKLAQAS